MSSTGPGGGAMNYVLQPKFEKSRDQSLKMGLLGYKKFQKYYNDALGYQKPYADFGTDSLNSFKSWTENPTVNDPSYDFRLNEGRKTVENSAAAKGGALSGNALRAITDYGQDYASREYGNEFQRWLQRIGLGHTAASNMSNIDAARAGQTLSAAIGAGQNWFNQTLASAQEIRQAEAGLNNILQSWIPAQYGGGKPTEGAGQGSSGGDFLNSWNSSGGSEGWGDSMMSQYGSGSSGGFSSGYGGY
jgi:hypothetical protein